MEEKYIAIKFEKELISEGIFLFKVKDIIDGMYNYQTNTLTDNYDNEYCSIEDENLALSEVEDCFGFPMTLEDLKECYKSEKTKKGIIKSYLDDMKQNIYFGVYDNNRHLIKTILANEDKIKNAEEDEMLEYFTMCMTEDENLSVTLSKAKIKRLMNLTKEENLEALTNNFKIMLDSLDLAQEQLGLSEKDELPTPVLKQEKIENDSSSEKINAINIKKELKKIIIGQDEAINKIVNAIIVDQFADSSEFKNRCMIVGKTGTGKTLLIKSLSEALNIPFSHVDTTQLTIEGYKGGTIEENIILPLILKANGNIESAQKGIVALDEIDKKGNDTEVAGSGVISQLLTFIDGSNYVIQYKNKNYNFNSSNLTIFAMGAFTDVFELKEKEKHKTMGFKLNEEIVENTIITREDLIKKGNMPREFMGRFSTLVLMNDLTLEDFKNIIMKSKKSQLLFYKKIFNNYGIKLGYSNELIDEIAKKAIELNLGGRAIKTIIEEILDDCKNEVLEQKEEYKKLTLQKDIINDHKKYKLT